MKKISLHKSAASFVEGGSNGGEEHLISLAVDRIALLNEDRQKGNIK
jgi:hypothetical protein